jgi:alkanesulfonate monooxygenase SsuD/methylene tetrahydromethanopterin reductase-like flavin-dependent oxidoreductase (luciferase family)
MEFSLIFEAQVPYASRENEQRVIRSAVDQAVLADELGFDRFYAVEHHGLESHAHSSAPETLLAFVAAKTRRIRVAHGVVCLPFAMNHPIRVAERTSMLDILSDGRMDVGVGRSSSRHEQRCFGLTDSETNAQLLESLRAIVHMWTEDEIEWDSEILKIPRRRIRPQPVQQPHPPLAMACSKDDSLELAARLGVGVLSNAADGPSQARRKREIYDAAIAARDPSAIVAKVPNDHFGATVFTVVGDDADEARRYGLRGMRFFMEGSRRWYVGGETPDPASWNDDENEDELRKMFEVARTENFLRRGAEITEREEGREPPRVGVGLANTTFNPDDVLDERSSAMGTPDHVIDFVERMADSGVDECYFLIQLGGVPDEKVLESISQIGKNVIPHFRRPSPTTVVMP